MLRILYQTFGSLVLLLLISCSACKTPEDDGIKRINLTTYAEEDQLTFGNNLYTILLDSPEDFPILDRTEYAEVYSYLNSLYYTLSHTNLIDNRDLFTWEVTILSDDDTEMAFTTPGGRFYIYTGLLKYIQGEHELASIMAHEMYYSDSGRGIEILQKNFSGDPFLLGDIYLGNSVPDIMEVVDNLKSYPMTPEDVTEADRFALNNICPFTYNAIGLRHLLDRSISDGGIDWTATRPIAEGRLSNLSQQANNCSNVEEDPTFADRYRGFTEKLP